MPEAVSQVELREVDVLLGWYCCHKIEYAWEDIAEFLHWSIRG
jgi:hypothetical protein